MIDKRAIISDDAIVGKNVTIGANAVIGENVKLGDNFGIFCSETEGKQLAMHPRPSQAGGFML